MHADSLATDITTSQATHHQDSWQKELAGANISVKELFAELELPAQALEYVQSTHELESGFKLRVPATFRAKMKKGEFRDPLLRQILPLRRELELAPGYSNDPLQESSYNPVPGLLHKYKSRALLTVTGNCAINCRYCFRRHFPYSENNPGRKHWYQAFDYIRQHSEINEVILSGGDPLSAGDSQLEWLINQLGSIEHLQRLRIHTRLPVVIPSRITETLVRALCQWPGKTVVVLHCNHPAEIDHEFGAAMTRLSDNGFLLLNQSVLLREVNDSVGVLAKLSEKLFDCGILPYYLHLLDPVIGAHHFEVDKHRAVSLHRELATEIPGFLLPRLVQELPGAKSKVAVELREPE